MRIRIFFLLFFIINNCTAQTSSISASSRENKVEGNTINCNNWLSTPSYGSFMQAGQVNVTGDKITVEATFNRTAPYSNGILYAGDLVSKHESPVDANYLLRPNDAEITTSNGYFRTPDICEIELNKTYHVAMVYDGATLKFYRNGFLMSQVAATGNLFQNNWRTEIGFYQSQFVNTQFIGYINEVRIWNVVRTQADIRNYMNTSLPSPSTQTGLLAYYTFDDLTNKQGNAAFNGTLSGAASINSSNPMCPFTADSCKVIVTPPNQTVIPVFTSPDTVCVNTPVNIVNKTVGATSNYWNFCVADLNTPPTAVNLGNIGGYFSQPTFVDYVAVNNNYYGFLTNYQNGNLIRLDFGNSLLNIPTAVNLGNFSGSLVPTNIISEGIQMIFNEGKWYAIIVGSGNTAGTLPRIFKVEFGTDITNLSPVVTDWGNIGNLAQPIDLHIFQDNGNWYGFTANSENNTITRFDFTSSFNNTPTAINLGNPGGLSYPTGIYAINDNGFWRVFIVNGGDNTTTGGIYSLTRLDFGSSLLNTPTAVNLGNPGNTLGHPRDLTIMRSCGQIVGFVVNGNPNYNDIAKLDFHNDLSSTPSAVSLGNIGNLNFPHSISKLFRVKDELYSFITNASGASNSLTRLRFAGCTNASISSSSLPNPPSITYNAPGTYNINLSVDDGLPTQNAYCKQVVVLPELIHTPKKDTAICEDSVKIGTINHSAVNVWNNGLTGDSIYVANNGLYWVESSRFGCSNRDSFDVRLAKIAVTAVNDTSICSSKPVQLNATASISVTYSWTPVTGLSNANIANPIATPLSTTQYIIKAQFANCVAKDTVTIQVLPSPVIIKTRDTIVCHDKTIQLNVSGGNTYTWQPDATLSNINIANPVASPAANKTYYITVTNIANCSSTDSIKILVKPATIFGISPDVSACKGNPVHLNAAGGDVYSWQPADGLSNPSIASPVATPDITTAYTVKIIENTCKDSASLSARITVLPLPIVKATSSNDVDCTKPVTQLNATGGIKYVWQPASSLNDSAITAPFASPAATTFFVVKGTDINGCFNYDSVKVLVTKIGDLLVNIPNAFTPNSDGRNECFGITRYAGLLKNVDFSVYDRFGVRVFHTTDALNCWDGKYKGKLQDANGFVYILKASTFCGEIFKKGIVMLIK